MTRRLNIRFTERQYTDIHHHLYPGDGEEHGVVLLAGLMVVGNEVRLMVREVHVAIDGESYVRKNGHYALKAHFIQPLIARARKRRLVYLAVHNHGSSNSVAFSWVDYNSHRAGYPALLDLAKGMPVGALVFGTNAIEADLWMPDGERLNLDYALVVGNTMRRLYSSPKQVVGSDAEAFDRQVRMFGKTGQARLGKMRVAVIGLGGIGSLVAELLARLGVGDFLLVDDDVVEKTNLSRLVGATQEDAETKRRKVDVATRHIREMNRTANITSLFADVAAPSVAEALKTVDYVFLAADSMRARIVVNAITQQFFVPSVQLGAKVVADPVAGTVDEAMSVVRPMRPGCGCLVCSEFVKSHKLSMELITHEERQHANYGVDEPNPSVITLNAVSASQAVNDFLFDMLELRTSAPLSYTHISHVRRKQERWLPRADEGCQECGNTDASRFAMGDAAELLAFEQFEKPEEADQAEQPERLESAQEAMPEVSVITKCVEACAGLLQRIVSGLSGKSKQNAASK